MLNNGDWYIEESLVGTNCHTCIYEFIFIYIIGRLIIEVSYIIIDVVTVEKSTRVEEFQCHISVHL